MKPSSGTSDVTPWAGRCALLVTPWHPRAPGGVTTAVTSLYDNIVAIDGWTARLLISSWEHRAPVESIVDGRTVIFARTRSLYVARARVRALAAFCLWFPVAAFRWRRLISRHRIALINVHYPGEDALFWVLMKQTGLFSGSVILSFHGADITEIRKECAAGARSLWHFITSRATALTACSRTLATELLNLFPHSSRRTHVIMNGIDARRITEEAARPWTSEDRPHGKYLTCITGFEKKKGLDVLLAAFSSVAAALPDIHLVLICRAGPDELGVRGRLNESPLPGRVTLLVDCPHDKAMSVLAGAEALILPSRKEPFGIAALEAAALARPVILTDVCGVLELIDASLFTVVPADDAPTLAAAILHLLSQPEAERARAERLKAALSERAGWPRAATELFQAAGLRP